MSDDVEWARTYKVIPCDKCGGTERVTYCRCEIVAARLDAARKVKEAEPPQPSYREWSQVLHAEIVAARLDAARGAIAYCIACVKNSGPHSVQWMATDWLNLDDAALARIVAPEEECPLCQKAMEVVSTSGCCMECYNKNTGRVRVMQQGWEKGEKE